MAAYRLVYDSRHLQADCQEPGSAPEPYARQSSMGYLYLLHKYYPSDDHFHFLQAFIDVGWTSCANRFSLLFFSLLF